jgi:hypothetical protein
MESRNVLSDARHNGISTKTLRRAKDSLGVVARKSGLLGSWQWHLPRAT